MKNRHVMPFQDGAAFNVAPVLVKRAFDKTISRTNRTMP